MAVAGDNCFVQYRRTQVSGVRLSYIAVTVENGDKRGWIFGGFAENEPINVDVGLTSMFTTRCFHGAELISACAGLLVSSVDIALPGGIRMQLNLPNLPANSLLVYRLTPKYDPDSFCSCTSFVTGSVS